MFSKNREKPAWLLLLASAISWILGQAMFYQMETFPLFFRPAQTDTTSVDDTETSVDSTAVEMTYFDMDFSSFDDSSEEVLYNNDTLRGTPEHHGINLDYRVARALGILLCIISVITTVTAVFVFRQKRPFIGPDGICLIIGILVPLYENTAETDYVLLNPTDIALTLLANTVFCFAVLILIREVIGWIYAKASLSWCFLYRLVKRLTKPQTALLCSVGWVLLASAGGLYWLLESIKGGQVLFLPITAYLTLFVFSCCCIFRYGADLNHFKQQLDLYQQGLPITVGNGAFSQTEAQLATIQAQYAEAIQTAVTSERFKVELISNVSHDLRTPLTAILGYSELLQKETLSPKGQEQLCKLYQKADYMNDLVESLFEMTKVSSGAVPCKKEALDLIRLLEQTIGLMDDQLVNAGLTVKRNYPRNAIPIVTDGGRMYQVFANLLGNAIKYALTGTRIYLEIKEEERAYLVRMTNTASYEMDFEPDEIIQRFARGDSSRSTKGSGLGLAIAQTYTESVGGTFRVSIDGDQFNAIVALPKTERNF